MTFRKLSPLVAAIAALTPTLAAAHVGAGETSGFAHGFAHPIGGLDHILAMVLVGLFAWRLGGRALWLVPASFVVLMAVGGALGVGGVALPFVEIGIALSVAVLGAAIAFDVKSPVPAAMAVVGAFAVFHGHAHGAEMPVDASGLGYGAGFVLATAILHAVGIGSGFAFGAIGERYGSTVSRVAGGVASIAGVGLMTGAL